MLIEPLLVTRSDAIRRLPPAPTFELIIPLLVNVVPVVVRVALPGPAVGLVPIVVEQDVPLLVNVPA
jgi:hypothetical protein